MTPSSTISSEHLFLLHTAIRPAIKKLQASVRTLSPLAPDAHVYNISRRLQLLRNIVLAHCSVEDNIILPTLRAAEATNRPAKRPRHSEKNPVLDATHNDHVELRTAFADLTDALSILQKAPMLTQDAPAHEPEALDLDDNESRPTRVCAIPKVRAASEKLGKLLWSHLDDEENYLQPLFIRLLDPEEQTELILRSMHATVSIPHLADSFRLVAQDQLAGLFSSLLEQASEDELQRIAMPIADALSPEQWTKLCDQLPVLGELVTPNRNPLIEITHLHKAIGSELRDLVAYCDSIDVTDMKQVQNLAARVEFLFRVHMCHSEGEDNVLLKELKDKLQASPCSPVEAQSFYEDHDNEAALFEDCMSRLSTVQRELREMHSPFAPGELLERKQELSEAVESMSSHIIDHMHEEETKLLPLVRKHFSLEDQDRMMRRVMARVPAEFLHELIPWMFGYLSVDEQESILRNLLRTAPPDEIHKVVSAIAQSVGKGMSDRTQWNELCLRVPEIELEYKSLPDTDEVDKVGPVSEILRVHKAFRIELNALIRRTKEIQADGSIPNPRTLASLADSVAFLRKMVGDHSKAEDEILLPRLEERVPGISARYKDDHCDERKLFEDLAKCLVELQCAESESDCEMLVQRLQILARTLRDEMMEHLAQEEEQMWPCVTEHFTPEEQSEIVALIFGQMPCSRLRELLPWMIRMLSVSESNTMMNHILQVTQSTMFETWLKTWLPLDEDMPKGEGANEKSSVPLQSKPQSDESRLPEVKNESDNTSERERQEDSPHSASTALMLLRGKDNIERTMRALARDSSLSVEARTRMMQQVMLAPYNEVRASALAAHRKRHNDKDDLSATYTVDRNGKKRHGCKHYMRACKIRAACCNKLYTCRLCHDDAEQTHIMDRTATTEVMCMHCSTLQPVSASCVNEKCRKPFARYFCQICVFYDDDDSRSVYHCHSCNVCRVGKGLGQDYFHCMKCNQCMSMKYQHNHVCIEKAMQSDCPVCHQYLFTSTSPVKYLQCGHLMHASCFKVYKEQCISCPVCAKSLEEMAPLYKQLDQKLSGRAWNMPRAYRTARCDIFCHDCQQSSNTAYHFVYNKCPKCSSYNTRVDRVDANADERRTDERHKYRREQRPNG